MEVNWERIRKTVFTYPEHLVFRPVSRKYSLTKIDENFHGHFQWFVMGVFICTCCWSAASLPGRSGTAHLTKERDCLFGIDGVN